MTHAQWAFEAEALKMRITREREYQKAAFDAMRESIVGALGLREAFTMARTRRRAKDQEDLDKAIEQGSLPPGTKLGEEPETKVDTAPGKAPIIPLIYYIAQPEMLEHLVTSVGTADREEKPGTSGDSALDTMMNDITTGAFDFPASPDPDFGHEPKLEPGELSEETKAQLRALGVILNEDR